MRMKMTGKELRRRARAVLTGKYMPATGLTLSMTLFELVLTMLLVNSGMGASAQLLRRILYWVLYVIILLLTALLEVGLIRVLYGYCKDDPIHEMWPLFYAFRHESDSFILVYAFRYLVSLIWFVPALLFYLRIPAGLGRGQLYLQIAQAIGLALIACIPAVLLTIPWCLSTYILLDNPACSPAEALRRSRLMTRGHKGEMLRLWLGFLPLLLLCLGTYGFGMLWVRPYFHTAMGELYLELKHE